MFAQPNQSNANTQQTVALPTLAQVMAGGTPSFFQREDPIGTSVTGTVESIEAQQQRDMDTQEPKWFDNGQPMMQVVIHVATNLRDNTIPGDDGVRAVYVKGKNLGTLRQASRIVGRDFPHVGDGFTATYTANGEAKKRGWNPPKLYSYEIVPNQTQVTQAMNAMPQQTATPATQPAQRPVAQQPTFQQPQASPTGVYPQNGYVQPNIQPQLNVQQIQALAAAGNTAEQIAGMLNIPVAQIAQVLQQYVPVESGDDPEF